MWNWANPKSKLTQQKDQKITCGNLTERESLNTLPEAMEIDDANTKPNIESNPKTIIRVNRSSKQSKTKLLANQEELVLPCCPALSFYDHRDRDLVDRSKSLNTHLKESNHQTHNILLIQSQTDKTDSVKSCSLKSKLNKDTKSKDTLPNQKYPVISNP